MPADDHHFRREDRAARWQRIADHLADHPDNIAIALENIELWLALGRVHPGPILEWRERLLAARTSEAAFQDFLHYVAKDDCDSNRLKSCSPFAGLPLSPPVRASKG